MAKAHEAGTRPMKSNPPHNERTAAGLSGSMIWIAAAGVFLFIVSLGVFFYLANKRGDEIAAERAKKEMAVSAGKLVQAFKASKTSLVMKDGSRQPLDGTTAVLLSTKPVAGEPGFWFALGRTSGGTYFGQRFAQAGGAMKPQAEAHEVASDVALGELKSQIAASGAEGADAQAFLRAASGGQPVGVRQ